MTLPLNLFLSLAVAASCGAANATDYDVRGVDFPGAANTAVYAINDSGNFVGAEKDAAGKHHAIIGNANALSLLGTNSPLGSAVESWAFSINRHGDVAGAFTDAAGAKHGYVLRADGAFEMIDEPGAAATQAYGINARGSVIGITSDSDGANPHAYVLRNGQFQPADLPGVAQTFPLSINEAEEIVGEAIQTDGTNGFGYLQGPRGRFTLVTAPGSAPEQTYFISINDRNEVLGGYADDAGNQHNFVRVHGGYEPFDLPPSFAATFVSAQTINNHEDIVGIYFDAAGVAHGFVAKAVH